MPRLFTAIEFPDDARRRLADICTGVEGAKRANSHQIHLTLRFIGDADEETKKLVESALDKISAEAFDLKIEGVGTFPPPGRKLARVLWAGVTPHPALIALQQKLEAAIQQCGMPPEPRKWSPHITLARFKQQPGHDLQRWLEANASLALPPIRVKAFHLFASERRPDGAIHAKVGSYPLSG
jgi:2'-5' RNA ligase